MLIVTESLYFEPQTHYAERRESRGRKDMSYRKPSNHYYKQEKEPQIRQLVAIPDGVIIHAVYKQDDNTEQTERIFLAGIMSDGSAMLLAVSDDGLIEDATLCGNFVRYTFG